MSKDTDPRLLRARIDALIKDRTRHDEATARKVQSVQRQTLSQSVTTIAHHINNSVMSIHSAATVIDVNDPEHVRKLQQVCRLEARKILSVIKALQTMAEFDELKTTPYLGEEMMFDLELELSKLDDTSRK
jgi:adenylosuccinate lyase